MPETYHVKLSDGREFNVTTEGGAPSEADVLSGLSGKPESYKPDSPLAHGVNAQEGEHEPDTWMGGFTKSLKDQFLGATVDNPLVQGAAHPQTVADFSSMLMPSGAPISKLLDPAKAATANAAAAVLENAPAVRKVIPFADAAAGKLRLVAQGAQDAGMGVTRGADMYQMPRVQRTTDSTARALEVAPEAPPPHLDLSQPVRPSELTPAELEQRMRYGTGEPPPRQGGATVQRPAGATFANPTGGEPVGRLRTMEPVPSHEPAPLLPLSDANKRFVQQKIDAIFRTHEQPTTAPLPNPQGQPISPEDLANLNIGRAVPYEAPVSDLAKPRMDIGAERVGRARGMDVGDVRRQAGPVLDEQPGTASPILPEKALQGIIDKMKSLPPGGPEREAYVQAATSGKAKWQIENIRRTLEHLGLLVPAAAAIPSDVRDALMQRLRASVTGGQIQ